MQGLKVAELAPVRYSRLERNTTGPPAEMLWSENRHALLGRRLTAIDRAQNSLAQMPREIRPPRRQDRRAEACRCRTAGSGALWSSRRRAKYSSSTMGNMRPWLSQSSKSAAAAARASSSVPPGRVAGACRSQTAIALPTSTALAVISGCSTFPAEPPQGRRARHDPRLARSPGPRVGWRLGARRTGPWDVL